MTPEEMQERLERIPDVAARALAREFVRAEPIDQRIDLFLEQQRTRSELTALRAEFRDAMDELLELRRAMPWKAQATGLGYTTLGLAGIVVATLKGWLVDPR